MIHPIVFGLWIILESTPNQSCSIKDEAIQVMQEDAPKGT